MLDRQTLFFIDTSVVPTLVRTNKLYTYTHSVVDACLRTFVCSGDRLNSSSSSSSARGMATSPGTILVFVSRLLHREHRRTIPVCVGASTRGEAQPSCVTDPIMYGMFCNWNNNDHNYNNYLTSSSSSLSFAILFLCCSYTHIRCFRDKLYTLQLSYH